MDYTHEEITAEMKRIGLGAYPKAEEFTDEEIAEAMVNYKDGGVTIAQLNGSNHLPEVVTQFAKLATTLNQVNDDVYRMAIAYEGMQIIRDSRPHELRQKAVGTLCSARYQRNRDEALNHLRDENLGSVRDYA